MELNSLIFPSPRPSYTADSFPGEMIWIPKGNPKDAIPCLFLSCPRGSSKVMLYFHGNAEDIGLAYELLDHIRLTLMVHVIAMEYPGYGIYKGKPGANQILNDSETLYDYLTEEIHVNPRDLIVFGRSIGSGPATWLAAKRSPGALLLISAYTSLRSVVRNIAGSFLMHLVKERFKNIDLMPDVTCPCFLVHGQRDTLIEYSNSQRLHEACGGPCSLILPVDMDHNEFDFFDDLSLPFSAFLLQCGITVLPESIQSAFLSVPPALYFPPNPNYRTKGL